MLFRTPSSSIAYMSATSWYIFSHGSPNQSIHAWSVKVKRREEKMISLNCWYHQLCAVPTYTVTPKPHAQTVSG